MNLQQLLYFRTIAETGSYTLASKQLFVSQPNLSHAVKQLELELKVPLFVRSGRNVELTEYGTTFLKHVNIITKDLDNAVNEIQQMRENRKETVRVVSSHALSCSYISELMQHFYNSSSENAGIRFDIKEGLARPINEAILRGDADVGFSAMIENEELVFDLILEEEMLLIMPKSHEMVGKEYISLKDIGSLPLITYSYDCGTRYFVDRIFAEAGIQPNIVQTVDNERLMASMVKSGLGIGIMPRIAELAFFDIFVTHLENGRFKRPLYMISAKNREISKEAALFRDYVREFAKETSYDRYIDQL